MAATNPEQGNNAAVDPDPLTPWGETQSEDEPEVGGAAFGCVGGTAPTLPPLENYEIPITWFMIEISGQDRVAWAHWTPPVGVDYFFETRHFERVFEPEGHTDGCFVRLSDKEHGRGWWSARIRATLPPIRYHVRCVAGVQTFDEMVDGGDAAFYTNWNSASSRLDFGQILDGGEYREAVRLHQI